jgi:hypothetical protein
MVLVILTFERSFSSSFFLITRGFLSFVAFKASYSASDIPAVGAGVEVGAGGPRAPPAGGPLGPRAPAGGPLGPPLGLITAPRGAVGGPLGLLALAPP